MRSLLLITILLNSLSSFAGNKDSTRNYALDDSIKAIAFYTHLTIHSVEGTKDLHAGIRTDQVQLSLESDKGKKEIGFEFPKSATILVTGHGAKAERGEIEWEYDWKAGESYKLLIAQAADSAGNFVLYSGYIWLNRENKWKHIGTCKINGTAATIKKPALFYTSNKKQSINLGTSAVRIQRSNGQWKNMEPISQQDHSINLLNHIDSLRQADVEKEIIQRAIANGSTDAKEYEGLYYKIIAEGVGQPVSVNDTVTAYYRLTAFQDTATIDQAKDTPATFPLKRLIRGWQLGVPLIRPGGKIKLVIPSGLAYSIRTRASRIPPNSILEFVIEVVSTKPPGQ